MADNPNTPLITTPLNLPDGKNEDAWVEIMDHRIQAAIAERGSWAAEARQAHRYYRSDQYRLNRNQSKDRTRMVANYIKPDVDAKVAAVLDSKPVVQPKGRYVKHHAISEAMINILDWTRDEEEDWNSDFENAIEDMFHIGEGVIYEGWDAAGDEGMGLPVSSWEDSRHILWHPDARKPQRDDAAWVISLKHVDLDWAKWKFQIEDLESEDIELFLTPSMIDRARSRLSGQGLGGSASRSASEEGQKVWCKRMWEKVEVEDKSYFKDGEAAEFMENGETYSMTEEMYNELSDKEREQFVELKLTRKELWETVVVGSQFIRRRLSPFDSRKGGHGHYPFSFYSLVRIRDESHARGEIGFIIGISDVRNETLSLMMDQALLANVGFLNVPKGSLPPEEREKLNDLGRDPFQIIDSIQGTVPPRWEGYNPTGTRVFADILPTLDLVQNRQTAMRDIDRGKADHSGQSGRAIRALQAKTQQVGVIARRHVESGLRRGTLLRLHNIAQFMRGNRAVPIVDPKSKEERNLFVGGDVEEIMATNGLREMPNPLSPGNFMLVDKTGQQAEVLILGDDMARQGLFDKISLKLDTQQEENELDRKDIAREMLRAMGPGSSRWFVDQYGLENGDQLLDDLEQFNQGMRMQKMLEDASKQTGLEAPQILEMFQQGLKQQGQQMQQQSAVPGRQVQQAPRRQGAA